MKEGIYMTTKDLVIDKARKGGYGFAIDRIMWDYRVKHAYRFNFRECLRDAVIDYAKEQLAVAKYYGYREDVVNDTLDNLQKQLEAFQRFDNDWEVACLLDEMGFEKALKAMRKEGEV